MASIEIEIPENGWIEGRNGMWNLHGISIWTARDGEITYIDGIGARDNVIRGGLGVPTKEMEQVVISWLEERGYIVQEEENESE